MPTPSTNRLALSYELFPPRSMAAGNLWTTIRELESTAPDYVSVTYGANGGNHDTALTLLSELVGRTTLRPLAHLTCVGGTRNSLRRTVTDLLDLGVRGVLALRGDIPDGYVPPDGAVDHAVDLIELIRDVERGNAAQLAAGRIAVGAAAYPTRHPESATWQQDIEVLAAKQAAGADFAITQVFFDASRYAALVRRARDAGVTIPIIPGILPMTSLRRVRTLARLAGIDPPARLCRRLAHAGSEADARRIGVDATVGLLRAALDVGAPGLHLYTFNQHSSALAVLDALNLPARNGAPTESEIA
ncbi:methylenetetrahydrofolate reductase [Spelaeicoccus albus]|uniref:Methylenetetrahydrofolate reductase n=1 Tax=Spelaeicoccus albus TaxID=1280376 RepID=A0A7Z0D1A5_9MICO|nr:methylenetetrahydrofolate reductase [Spelaeicoccus albus]NYI65755.1 methylenetetrahydrofolate reductase (NADPH) [Spelaeicoccus albus]